MPKESAVSISKKKKESAVSISRKKQSAVSVSKKKGGAGTSGKSSSKKKGKKGKGESAVKVAASPDARKKGSAVAKSVTEFENNEDPGQLAACKMRTRDLQWKDGKKDENIEAPPNDYVETPVNLDTPIVPIPDGELNVKTPPPDNDKETGGMLREAISPPKLSRETVPKLSRETVSPAGKQSKEPVVDPVEDTPLPTPGPGSPPRDKLSKEKIGHAGSAYITQGMKTPPTPAGVINSEMCTPKKNADSISLSKKAVTSAKQTSKDGKTPTKKKGSGGSSKKKSGLSAESPDKKRGETKEERKKGAGSVKRKPAGSKKK